jgi:hypothetical protein
MKHDYNKLQLTDALYPALQANIRIILEFWPLVPAHGTGLHTAWTEVFAMTMAGVWTDGGKHLAFSVGSCRTVMSTKYYVVVIDGRVTAKGLRIGFNRVFLIHGFFLPSYIDRRARGAFPDRG